MTAGLACRPSQGDATTYIRGVLAERRRQINLVVLLVYENLPNLLCTLMISSGLIIAWLLV
jgi:hypothetical protein